MLKRHRLLKTLPFSNCEKCHHLSPNPKLSNKNPKTQPPKKRGKKNEPSATVNNSSSSSSAAVANNNNRRLRKLWGPRSHIPLQRPLTWHPPKGLHQVRPQAPPIVVLPSLLRLLRFQPSSPFQAPSLLPVLFLHPLPLRHVTTIPLSLPPLLPLLLHNPNERHVVLVPQEDRRQVGRHSFMRREDCVVVYGEGRDRGQERGGEEGQRRCLG